VPLNAASVFRAYTPASGVDDNAAIVHTSHREPNP